MLCIERHGLEFYNQTINTHLYICVIPNIYLNMIVINLLMK